MFTTTEEVKKYPFLIENDAISLQIKHMAPIEQTLLDNQKSLSSLVLGAQNECPHKNCKEERGPQDIYGGRHKVLISKTCSDCGFVFKKPEGNPWDICTNCWSPMKFTGTIPGQGERTQCYECTKCSAEHQHH